MKLHPRVTPAAVALVARFEPLRLAATRGPDGRLVIGYGHTLSARKGATVSRADALTLLLFDLSRTAGRVDAAVAAPTTDAQFEALTAFAFDAGPDAFAASDVARRLDTLEYSQAAAALKSWRREGVDDAARVEKDARRRAAEAAHFVSSNVEAPSVPAGLPPPAPDDAPAPNASVAAADALRARLDLILAEPAPQSAPEPDAQESDIAPAEPEPTPEPEPEPEPPPFLAEVAPASEPGPADAGFAQEPLEPLAPFPAAPALPAEAPEPAPSPMLESFGRAAVEDDDDVPPPRAPMEVRRDWLREETGGRRPSLWRRLAEHPLAVVALGAAGAVMFLCALVGMATGRPAVGWLVLGFVGVLAMAPAAAVLLFRRLDRGGG